LLKADRIKFPNQGQRIHNDLVETLLDNKDDEILKFCISQVYNGETIMKLIKKETLESLRDGIDFDYQKMVEDQIDKDLETFTYRKQVRHIPKSL